MKDHVEIDHLTKYDAFRLNSIILGQMINLDMIFHVVVSVYRLVKI